jgi:hypothetical protein
MCRNRPFAIPAIVAIRVYFAPKLQSFRGSRNRKWFATGCDSWDRTSGAFGLSLQESQAVATGLRFLEQPKLQYLRHVWRALGQESQESQKSQGWLSG